MIDEQASFRISDKNGSRFVVEERIDYKDNSHNYRISIDTKSGATHFYATEGQYRLFIQSEAERLTAGGND